MFVLALTAGIQGYFSICNLVDTIKHINRGKDNNHLVISVDGAKLLVLFKSNQFFLSI